MKLAISNIAWSPHEDDAVAGLMRAHGYSGVEIAPTKYWQRPLAASAAETAKLRTAWEARGLPIVAMQSLLFGTEGLALFGTDGQRAALGDYLRGIFKLASILGARALVFGSPKQRLRGPLSAEDAAAIAVPFFRELAMRADEAGVCLCIEPNPPAYGCDWITDSRQGRAMVDAVGHRGFGLHLDAAGMTLAGEDVAAAIQFAGPIRHFHASEPGLARLHPGGAVDHETIARALRSVGYEKYVSIEMRAVEGGEGLTPIDSGLARVAGIYSSGN